MTRLRRSASFLILAMTGGVIFQVAYLRFLFLSDGAEALGLTVQEYGTVTSVFGAVAVVMYFLGGWFADKFSPKLLIIIAMAGTGALDLYVATAPGYWMVLIVHALFAVLGMGLYWSALVKSISLLGSEGEQGRLFGFLEGIRGLTTTVIGLVGSAIVAQAVVASAGVTTLIRIYGVLALVLAVLVHLVVHQGEDELGKAERQSVGLRELLKAATNKYTWLIGGTVMMMYSFYTLMGYLSPLLQDGFGVAAGMIGVIGVIRTYVFQFVAGPVGGVLVDKMFRSTPRFLRLTFAIVGLTAVGYLLLPPRAGLLWIAVALMVIMSLAVFAARGVYWASVGELGIPAAQRGGVIGLASGLAYLPDAFLPAVASWWIGDPSNGIPSQGGGFSSMFLVLIGAAVIGMVLCTVTMRIHSRETRAPESVPTPA
ncbi:MFS transporter [Brachybacterium fresconis]|uniref:MFS family arabinose efflux permease n=1 Tax=Brachybacterium fresconis TaxID=173363 RepID=A0ABS4YPD7_9MICO|nr:MFS transporter [Brachybacterium fresconis]MBP2410247.1 putative MFS family arabinose efflux permease [Brachybacterium fresconis]